jgi:hypothetical protein
MYSIETENALLPPRQQAAAQAEKRFAKAMIKIADKAKEETDMKYVTNLAIAMVQEHTFVLGTDPLAIRVFKRRKEQL